MKQLVLHLAKGKMKDHDDHSTYGHTGTSNVPIRCQILCWYFEDEVVIGEGELCSVEPNYKIGCIPIGPNAAAVVVTFTVDKEAYVWRPTTTITSLGEAVETKIAWPFDKLIFDSMNSQTVNKIDGSARPSEAMNVMGDALFANIS